MQVPQGLYSQIVQMMPIPCVDLLVSDQAGEVLLLLRRNEPAAGCWWFPGGRVLFGETRYGAAARKLDEECGLAAAQLAELATYDLVFELGAAHKVHSITTLFRAMVDSTHGLALDSQSAQAMWSDPGEWLERDLHPFVRAALEQHAGAPSAARAGASRRAV